MYRVKALHEDDLVMYDVPLGALVTLMAQRWDNVGDAGHAVEQWYKELRHLVHANETMCRSFLAEDGGRQWPIQWAWLNDDTAELILLLWLEQDIWVGVNYSVTIVPKEKCNARL